MRELVLNNNHLLDARKVVPLSEMTSTIPIRSMELFGMGDHIAIECNRTKYYLM